MTLSSIFGECFCCPVEAWPKTPATWLMGPPLLRVQPAPEWSAVGQQEGCKGKSGLKPTDIVPLRSSFLLGYAHTYTHTQITWILWIWGGSVCVYLCVVGLLDPACMTISILLADEAHYEVCREGGRGVLVQVCWGGGEEVKGMARVRRGRSGNPIYSW